MKTMTMKLTYAATIVAVGVFAGGAVSAAQAQSAPAPSLIIGDKWVYNVKSGIGLTTTTYQETREVTAVSAKGGKIKVTGKTADGKDFTRVEEFSAPGTLTSGALCFDQVYRFPTPLQRVAFPVAPGQRSSKWVDVIAEPGGATGQMNYSFRTQSWDKQTVPAGSFDAIRVDVLMVLDDATPFRNATNCNFTYWYSPPVRGTVRERHTAQYTQLDQQAEYRVLDQFYELASFTPGKR
jgi:hypothetical protein